jgi:hypothetical protein
VVESKELHVKGTQANEGGQKLFGFIGGDEGVCGQLEINQKPQYETIELIGRDAERNQL